MNRIVCLLVGHRWEGDPDDYTTYPILHCTRCGKRKAFPEVEVLDPVWRLGRIGRFRLLATRAAHYVGLVVAIGLAIAGVVALLTFVAGDSGRQIAKAAAITLGVVGGLGVLTAVVLDPMGIGPGTGGLGVSAGAGFSPLAPYGALPDGMGRIMRLDDVLYGGGAVLIGIALLLGFVVL